VVPLPVPDPVPELEELESEVPLWDFAFLGFLVFLLVVLSSVVVSELVPEVEPERLRVPL
jgi:hypothetical protein